MPHRDGDRPHKSHASADSDAARLAKAEARAAAAERELREMKAAQANKAAALKADNLKTKEKAAPSRLAATVRTQNSANARRCRQTCTQAPPPTTGVTV
jgi:hypothetical protein